MDGAKGQARMNALDALAGDAERAPFASRLPREKRPKGFMISIGLIGDDSEDSEPPEVEIELGEEDEEED